MAGINLDPILVPIEVNDQHLPNRTSGDQGNDVLNPLIKAQGIKVEECEKQPRSKFFGFFHRLFSILICCHGSDDDGPKLSTEERINQFRENWRANQKKLQAEKEARIKDEKKRRKKWNTLHFSKSANHHEDKLQGLFQQFRHLEHHDQDFKPFIYINPTTEKEVEMYRLMPIRNFANPSTDIAPLNPIECAAAYLKTWDPKRKGDMEYAKSMVEKWEKDTRDQLLVLLKTRPYVGRFRDSHFSSTKLFAPFMGLPPRELYDKSFFVLDVNEQMISTINGRIKDTGLEVVSMQTYSQIVPTQKPARRLDERTIGETVELIVTRNCATAIKKMDSPSSLFTIRAFYLCVFPYRYYEITVRYQKTQSTIAYEDCRFELDNVSWHAEDRHMELEKGLFVENDFKKYFNQFEANVYLMNFFDEIENDPESQENFLNEHGVYLKM